MFQFYAAGIANATPAEEVGALILHAITTDTPQLRYPCSWGGESIVNGRAAMTDNDWVSLGAADTDEAYFAAFSDAFGVDLSKS
jgi:hypothetical protein